MNLAVSEGGTGGTGNEADDDAKVIVRSNGTVTYVGKDIAYQMWKFGLLGRDFAYRRFHTYPNGHTRVDQFVVEEAIRPPRRLATRTKSST